MSYYSKIAPIENPIPAHRQQAKRHYGVHPYFTRRPYNVVRDYILHYSQRGDRVLDPFGGSGVTAIEAFLENRVGIHNDINPFANFIAEGIAKLHEGESGSYFGALSHIEAKCKKPLADIAAANEGELDKYLRDVNLPENITLPTTADVEKYHELFSLRQLISLAILKDAIDSTLVDPERSAMLLAWSATLAKLNKTFLSTKGRAESRGGSSIFSIYRYKVAKQSVELSPWETFHERARNVIKAKIEINRVIELKEHTGGWSGRFESNADDVECLAARLHDSVDYIFTDPPYGGHIAYLDLSVLWNHWLGFTPDEEIRQNEIVVGGQLQLTEAHYLRKLRGSIEACLVMLKRDRWLSIVFQHWNTIYFQTILSSALECGAELRAAVSQIGDPIWSMHKKKRKESILAGEMILTFHKSGKSEIRDGAGKLDVVKEVAQLLAETQDRQIYGESIFNQLIIRAWQKSAIGSLDISRDEFIQLLNENGWNYDAQQHYWIKGAKSHHSLLG